MLIIRAVQCQALCRSELERFIDEMMVHLDTFFPTMAWLRTGEELRREVADAIGQARSYGLVTQQQLCRFINVAATYGWRFDSDPGLCWIHETLTDTELPCPGDRLDRLVQTCLHRQRIERHNEALRRQLGLISPDNAAPPPPQPAEDYLGPTAFRNTEPAAPDIEEYFTRNPLAYHLSRSLWRSRETLPTKHHQPVIHAGVLEAPVPEPWTDNGGSHVVTT